MDNLQQQPQIPPMDYSFFKPKDTEDYNKFMQTMDGMIEFTILRMGGKAKVIGEDGNYKIEQITQSMLNEIGINFIETKLRTYLTANTYMSKLDEKEADKHAIQEVKSLASVIRRNMGRYGLRRESISEIIPLLCPIIIFALKKSVSDKGFIEATTQNKYINQSRDATRGTGLFDGVI